MLFNVKKCKVLHVGYNNMWASYFIGNTEIEIQSTDEERDLGVIVHKSLKVSSQCNKVVKEAYSVLGVINRCFLNTRSSADADNRLDAFCGQSRSTNIVPFHMLHIVSYCATVTCL